MFLVHSFGDADGSGRTDEAAEMAADALCADDAGLAGFFVEGDGLVSAVQTGDMAAATAYATVSVDFRIGHRLAVEVGGKDEVGQLLAH